MFGLLLFLAFAIFGLPIIIIILVISSESSSDNQSASSNRMPDFSRMTDEEYDDYLEDSFSERMEEERAEKYQQYVAAQNKKSSPGLWETLTSKPEPKEKPRAQPKSFFDGSYRGYVEGNDYWCPDCDEDLLDGECEHAGEW